jgi:uncharacterized membrane protein
MRDALLFLSVFLACAVEGVEALTVVLAVGTTRDWRSTWYGVAAALVALSAAVALVGPALTAIPINGLRLVVGGLLLGFGLQWLRKAIQRAAGVKPKHDEIANYEQAVTAARGVPRPVGGRAVGDWYAFTIAFKSVLLEGLEVVFIVLTFGSNQGSIPLAAAGAVAAIGCVAAAGVAVRRPLAKVPENTLKFAVGVMLTSFGAFWGAEGAGAVWPGGDAALPFLIAGTTVMSLLLVVLLGRLQRSMRAGLRQA